MIDHISPPPKFLVNKYKKWRSESFSNNKDHFKKLASLGQHPSSMIISCCDSRVHPTTLFGAIEGELFIYRNIANLVPPSSSNIENYGTAAAIEYAIKVVKIKHLIILGHTDCGGVKSGHSLYSNKIGQEYEYINKWLDLLLPAFDNIDKNIPEKKQISQLEEESIKNSINNLFSFSFIKKKVEEKTLSIHGLIQDIESGELKFLNPHTKKFENI